VLIQDIIAKKKTGGRLSRAEIDFFIEGIVSGDIPDYQTAALLMAIWIRGMDVEETVDLTLSMAESGEMLDLSEIPGIKLDKHSTGGVADTTTLILAPLVASLGYPVAKLSGRGLGHTGGTLDKLESIPGMRVDLTKRQFIDQVKKIGLAVSGQTADIAPADRILYALRDVTSTTDNISLMASSIMSKKLASGSDAIVLDVKTGRGAFLPDVGSSVELAKLMVDIGRASGRRMAAVVTDMDQPLGSTIGNALEVIEAAETLKAPRPSRLLDIVIRLATLMVRCGGDHRDDASIASDLMKALTSGRALEKLIQMVDRQGGDPRYIEDTTRFELAGVIKDVESPVAGWVKSIDALGLGKASVVIGAGRKKKGDPVDFGVGMVLAKQVGDKVGKAEPFARVYARSEADADAAVSACIASYSFSEGRTEALPLVYETIE